MSTGFESRLKVVVLEEGNWLRWKTSALNVLKAQGLLSYVNGTIKSPVVPEAGASREAKVKELEEWERKDAQAMQLLQQSMDEFHFQLVMHCSTSAEVWTTITNQKESATTCTKYMAQIRWFRYKWEQDMTVGQYLSGFNMALNDASRFGDDVKDSWKISKLIGDLPDKYSSFAENFHLFESKKLALTFDEIVTQLTAIEKTRAMKAEVKSEPGLSGSSDTSALAAYHKRNTGSGHRKTDKGKEKRKKSKCFNCNQEGHFAAECRKPKREKISHKTDEESSCALGAVDDPVAVAFGPAGWMADTGCSQHMSKYRHLFSSYELLDTPRVINLAKAGERVLGIAKGNMDVEVWNGKQWKRTEIQDVLHVPDMIDCNLFSIKNLLDKDFSFTFEKQKMEVKAPDGKIVVTGHRKSGSMVMMAIRPVEEKAMAAVSNIDNVKLWHERLGHVGIDRLKQIVKSGALGQVKVDGLWDNFQCEGCLKGKNRRKPFQTSAERECLPGEFIHSDVWGPAPTESVGHNRYFVLFKCEASGFKKVYMMRTQEAPELVAKFTQFLIETREETGRRVRRLRCDNGGAYKSELFLKLLLDERILMENSAPNTHEQNGRAEREIQTLVRTARSCLKASGLPDCLWGEAVATSAYLGNRVLKSTSDSDKSPYEQWMGKEPNLQHLRVIGSKCFVHVPKEQRKKLDDTAKEMILVGYMDMTTTQYKCWDPKSRRIFVSRDVTVMERVREVTTTIVVPVSPEVQVDHEDDPNEKEQEKEKEKAAESETENEKEGETWTDARSDVIAKPVEEVRKVGRPPGSKNQPKAPPAPHKMMTRNKRLLDKSSVGEDVLCALVASSGDLSASSSYQEVLQHKEKDEYLKAMAEEFASLTENETWDLVSARDVPKDKQLLNGRWVCRVKEVPGQPSKHKARFVVQGFRQREGLDYGETFSPVVRYDSLRVILSLAAAEDYDMVQFDVKTAFLYGTIDEELYMHQPDGFDDGTGRICRLKKSLYGLKQAPRKWNERFHQFLKKLGFKRSTADYCVYTGTFNGERVIICLYVDDGMIFGRDKDKLQEILSKLEEEFKITKGDCSCYVGLQIKRDRQRKTITVGQQSYLKKLFLRFNMQDAKPASTPGNSKEKLSREDCPVTQAEKDEAAKYPYRAAVGSLMFAMLLSRPDIAYEVGQVSRFLENPGRKHVMAVKRIIRYLIKTEDYCITYGKRSQVPSKTNQLVCYSDADYAANTDTRRSTTGYVNLMNGGPVTWCSRSQESIATSTVEAEYVAAAEACKEVIWLRRLLTDIGFEQKGSTVLYCDNQGAIAVSSNPEHHKRTKHIDVRFHLIREKQEEGLIAVKYIPTANQVADFLTKSLCSPKLVYHCTQMNLM